MIDHEFQALMDKYSGCVAGVAPLHTWATGDIIKLIMALDQELERRNLERHCPYHGQYDDYC